MVTLSSLLNSLRTLSEPVQLLYVLMVSTSLVAVDRIYIDKVCTVNLKEWLHSLNYTTEVCSQMRSNTSLVEVQKKTQEIVAELKTYEGVILALPSILFSLFAGSWSDSNGRRPLLVFPFLGNIVSFLLLLVNIHWWDELPAQFLLTSGVAGLTGGWVCLNIGLYSYMADTTPSNRRTARMSLLSGIFSLGFVAGVQLGAAVEDYVVRFCLSLGFGVLGMTYAALVLKETVEKPSKHMEKEDIDDEVSGDDQPRRPLMSWRHIVESLKTAFGPRPGQERLSILVLLFSFFTLTLCQNTTDFDFLMTRLKFSWDSRDFSNYLTVQRVCRLVSLLLLLPLLSSLLMVRDSLIMMSGLISTCLAYLLLLTSSPSWGNHWPMFLSAGFQLNSVTSVTIRAQLSKLVGQEEVGKMFAVVGVGQSLVSLISQATLGLIYRLSLSTWPTAYLVPVVGALCLSFSAQGVLALLRRARSYEEEKKETDC